MNIDWTRPQKAASKVQDYAWGEVGPGSFLGKLLGDESEGPKAELWMGAHPKCPSIVGDRGLDQWLRENPSLLGEESLNIDPKGLPYLFKVLSAARPLSIQLHPNKAEAADLHARDPEHYPDDNHKPEIAIALEEHEALLGFEPLDHLIQALDEFPELRLMLDKLEISNLEDSLKQSDDSKREALKAVFSSLFVESEKEPEKLKETVRAVRQKLLEKTDRSAKENWFLELSEPGHEGDVGLLCLFFLNYRVLKPGEGVFLKADVPHAYLRGNIIECMANSDNVVRAGLTPKFVDVETLAKIVQVELEPLAVQVGEDNALGGSVYRVPVREFEVHHWSSDDAGMEVDIQKLSGPRFGVILNGKVTFEGKEAFSRGEVFFLSDLCGVSMKLDGGSELYLARPAI